MADNADEPKAASDGIFQIEGQPYTENVELGRIATVAASVAVGAMLGAGAALLLAPASGEEIRSTIRRRARKLTRRERGVWQSLGRALEEAANARAARSRLRARAADAADAAAAAVKAST